MKICEIMETLNVSDNVLMKIISDPESKKFWEKNYRNNPDDKYQSIVTASGVMAIKEYLAKNGKTEVKAEIKAKPEPKAEVKAKPEPKSVKAKPETKSETEPKAEPPKRRRRAKPEGELTIKVEKSSPFLSESQLRQALIKDGVKCRQILVKEGFVKESTLAYTSDEAVLDIMVTKFIGMKEGNTLHLYKRSDV